jgi:hypothetical protein
MKCANCGNQVVGFPQMIAMPRQMLVGPFCSDSCIEEFYESVRDQLDSFEATLEEVREERNDRIFPN